MADEKQNQLFESVSALMDNQASPLELQRILAHAEKQSGVRERWHRYQLVRSIMQGGAGGMGFSNVADNVKQRIADLDLDLQPRGENASAAKVPVAPSNNKSPWFAAIGRVAIAASVAVVAVLGSQQLTLMSADNANDEVNANLAATDNSAYQPVDLGNGNSLPRLNFQNVSISSSPVRTSNRLDPDAELLRQQRWEEEQVRQALQRLLLEHAQQASAYQSQGLMPFIRVSDSVIMQDRAQ